MAEIDFPKLITSAILLGLFVVAIVGFSGNLANINSPNSSILQDPTINSTVTLLSANLSESQDTTTNQSISQDESEPIAIFDFLSESIVGTLRILKGTLRNIYNITFGLVMNKLGVDPVVVYSMVSILLVMMIFLVWRSMKRG
jgi:hypothetical protein